MKRFFTLVIGILFAVSAYAQTEIKFATLAPDGSSWMKTIRQIGKEVQSRTNNAVTFKFYPGGVQGDEIDMLRKVRIGQLHAAGFTGNGLGEILPEVRVLEVPYLFQSAAELDSAVSSVGADLEAGFIAKGFVLLGWADVGFVHFFSRDRIQTPTDLTTKKVWQWQGDPLARELFKSYGVSPIQLPVTDVLTSLQTGMIDVVYASPLAAIALQWQTRTKYVTEQPLTYASGGVLLSKKIFDKLTPEQQKILMEVARRELRKLTLQTRLDNATALTTLKTAGLSITPIASTSEQKKMEAIGVKTRLQLSGKLFSKELLQRVETAAAKAR